MARTDCETADFVIERIRALGFTPHPESRLMKMRRVLFDGDSPRIIIEPGDIDFQIALESLRDMKHFGFVFDHFDPSLDTEASQRLNDALSDCILPQDNLKHSPGRDAQFELFVAAICANAGLLPVVFAEPDLQVVVSAREFPEGSQKFGIAVKRIKSTDNFEDNIRSGAKQILRAGLPGIIAVDTCVALNRGNKPILAPMAESKFCRLHKAGLRRFIDDYYKRLQEWVRARGVRAIIFHDHQRWLHPEFGWTIMSIYMVVDTSRTNASRKREYKAFWKCYGLGLPAGN